MANKHMEICLTTCNHWGNTHYSHMKCHFTLIRVSRSKETKNIPSDDEYLKHLKLTH